MMMVLLGPPAAGKGTQAAQLLQRYDLVHVATGDMLRAAIAAGTALGRQAQVAMDAGSLVSDDLVIAMINQKLDRTHQDVLFDGFPRTLSQARALDVVLGKRGRTLQLVVSLDIPQDVLMRRISERFFCLGCGAVYHRSFHPLKVVGVCNVCGSKKLARRSDDTQQAFKKRLKSYSMQTAPLLQYYCDRGVCKCVDASAKREDVTRQIVAVMESAMEPRPQSRARVNNTSC